MKAKINEIAKHEKGVVLQKIDFLRNSISFTRGPAALPARGL